METRQEDFFNLVDRRQGRHRNPDYQTSVEGAEDVAYRAGSQKARLLAVYKAVYPAGLTDEEAATRAGLPITSCYWKRCGELRQDGYIEMIVSEAGALTRPGQAGVSRVVCVYRRPHAD
jgi:hypothetical protein